MNRQDKHNALLEIFRTVPADGQWCEVTAPSGYVNRFRRHGYSAGVLTVYIVEAYSGNGYRPGDTIGTVTIHNETGECIVNPLTFKRYLHQWKGSAE